jgi:cytochrome c-type biogenesis protein CcmF
MRRSLREDVYTIVGTIDPQSKRATFNFHLNPLVGFIWLGLLVLMGGATISLWPEAALGTSRVWSFARAGAGVATGTMFAIWLCMSPASAYATPRPRPAPVVMRAESPLPRLWETGAIWAPVAGLGLGAIMAGVSLRRPRGRRS